MPRLYIINHQELEIKYARKLEKIIYYTDLIKQDLSYNL